MKKLLAILIAMTVLLSGVSALDIAVTRDYPTEGFTIKLDGKPEFRVDSTIWKANTLGYRISSINKHVWEITDGSDRIIVALGADSNDMLSLKKHLDKNPEGLTLFVSMDSAVPDKFFLEYSFQNVAMQSYTPEIMRSLRQSKTLYYPIKYTDVIRVEDGYVTFLSQKDLESKKVEVKTQDPAAKTDTAASQQAEIPTTELPSSGQTIIVICPHCGEQITVKLK